MGQPSAVKAEDVSSTARAKINDALAHRDFASALQILKPLGDGGNGAALRTMAFMYRDGLGVTRSMPEALRLFRLAAAKGDAGSQYQLGQMYLNGFGVKRSEKAAAQFFLMAADQGLSDAEFELGNLYSPDLFDGAPAKLSVEGRGQVLDPDAVQKDAREAFRWYKLSAEQGVPAAQYNLATLFSLGSGIPVNDAESVHRHPTRNPTSRLSTH